MRVVNKPVCPEFRNDENKKDPKAPRLALADSSRRRNRCRDAANTLGTDIRSDDSVTSFSSRGPTRSYWKDSKGVKHYDNLIEPDLVAPGNRIIGAAAADNKLDHPELCVSECGKAGSNGKGNMRLSGTLVSARIVGGAVAIVVSDGAVLSD